MRAVTISRHGPASVLELREGPDPEPGPGEVRIRVRAAGLNFSEVLARQGLYPDAPRPPCVLGYEASGTVDQLGPGTTGFAIGERVWAVARFGAHADLLCTPAPLVRHMPETLSFEEAAAIPVNYAAALLLVSHYGCVRPGDRVLIHMAAGGVGTAAIQLCRRVPRVTLFGTASASKHEALRRAGVDHPIDYRTVDFEAEVRRLTGSKGVHVILDPLGGAAWRKNYRLLAPTGRLMLYGVSRLSQGGHRSLLHALLELARTPLWNPLSLMNQNRAVMGLHLGHLFDRQEILGPGLDALAELVEQGTIRPTLDRTFPFSRAAEAHQRIESRANVGKVLLVPE